MTPVAHPDNPPAADAMAGSAPAFRLEVDEDGIRHLVFDTPGSSANLFRYGTLRELEARIRELQNTPGIRGLVIRSAKPRIFIAGADLKAMLDGSPEQVDQLVAFGQLVFGQLAALPFPKVAAIHGACLGGGYELALACDRRIASDDSSTRIGLPETQLGLIPAWGGTTRLTKLIGVRRACEVILKGGAHPPAVAARLGLVDEVVPPHCLLKRACEWILRGSRPRRPVPVDRLASPLIRRSAEGRVRLTTRGNFPALTAAIDVISRAPWRTVADSLAAERAAFRTLIRGPEARNLTGLFFARESLKKRRVEGGARPVRCAAVIGAGVMGSGIAYWLSTREIPVILTDISHNALALAEKRIADACRHARRRHLLRPGEARAVLDRITLTLNDVSLKRADLVIEAATEDPDLKRRLFAELDGRVRPDALLATNTSAIPVHTLSDGRPLIGLHFFNPVHAMPLVEVVRPDGVPDDIVAAGVQFVQAIGRLPLVVKDSPGFLVNRVLMPYLMEAARMVGEGAGIRSVDDAMLSFGMPMGPLRLLDEVGLDVALHVARTLTGAFPWLPDAAGLLEARVAGGDSGRKSGRGYYIYGRGRDPVPVDGLPLRPDDVAAAARRLPLLLTNEAARCLDEGVVTTAWEADAGMVLGTGYAPFRGGPLRHADETGIPSVVADLRQLSAAHGGLYDPAHALTSRAESGGLFHEPPAPHRHAFQ